MNELISFSDVAYGKLRGVLINNEPWLVWKDVVMVLGYKDTKSALTDPVDIEDKKIIKRGQIATFEIPNRGMTFINESGLYSLVLSSKLHTAKKFKWWVTGEILPAIRKTGSYTSQNNNSSKVRETSLIVAEIVNAMIPVITKSIIDVQQRTSFKGSEKKRNSQNGYFN